MQATLTLGELLYANPAVTRVSEKEWLALVHAIAAGDEAALRLLCEKTQPLVFTYLMRLTGDRALTEQLILELFQMVWCEAPVFTAADGPVLGWIMRQARARALEHLRDSKTIGGVSDHMLAAASNDPIRSEDLPLGTALEALTMQEREAIEATFLNGWSYAEIAARRGEAVGTIKSRIRSGLTKLRQALPVQGDRS